jgi:CheY-like chemotaxis protein
MRPDAPTSPHHKVLYVEDQAVNTMLMSALFERIPGCELVLAECGSQALERARDLYPALLLLDLRLPDMHGSQLLPQLRRVPGCEHVPAIAVTAEHEFDIARGGFDELWRKPLNLLRVLERVEGYLALATAQRKALLRPAQMPLLTTPDLVARIAAQA